MAGPTLATLGLRVDAQGFITGVNRSRQALDGFGTSGKVAQGVTASLQASFTRLAGIFGVGLGLDRVIRETIDSQNAMAQLDAAVQSTGGAAGRSVQQLDDLAQSLQGTTVYSDEAVKGAEAILLTFSRIRGKEFDGATRAVTDLAARMGTDLPTAALQLGKALEDPAVGLTALRRAGIVFGDDQIAVIKKLNETGHAAEAQDLTLKLLEQRVGGSAVALRNTLGGALAAVKNNFGDLLEVSKAGTHDLVDGLNTLARILKDDAAGILELAKVLGTVALAFGAAKLAMWGFAAAAPLIAGIRLAVQTLQADLAVMALAGTEGFAGMAKAASLLNGTILSFKGAASGVAVLTAALWAFYEVWKLFRDLNADEAAKKPTAAQAQSLNWASALADAARATGQPMGASAGAPPPPRAPVVDPAAAAQLKAYQDHRRELENQIRTRTVLNANLGQSEHNIRLITIALEAQTRANKIVAESTGTHRAALLALNDQYTVALVNAANYVEVTKRLGTAHEQAKRAFEDASVTEAAKAADAVKALEARKKVGAELQASDLADIRRGEEANKAAADDRLNVYRTMLKDMQRATADFFKGVLDGGISSLQALFDAIRGLWDKLIADLAAAKLSEQLAAALPIGLGGAAKRGLGSGGGLAGDLMAGMAGLGIGYGFGSQVGGAGGVALGIMGGAGAGFAIAGPVGAAVGGLTGLIGGLLGSSAAAEKAAAAERALAAAREEYVAQSAATIAQLGFAATYAIGQGQGLHLDVTVRKLTPEQQALAQVDAQFASLREKARQLYEGTANYSAELNRLNAVEVLYTQQIKDEWALKQRQWQEDYAVRTLRAQGLGDEADALAFAEQQQREFAQAIRDGADATTQAVLQETLRQEAIARTAEVAIAAAQKEADAAQNRLSAAQTALEGTKAQLQSLRSLSATLQGATASPATALAAARAALDAAAGKARAGDAAAIGNLPQVAQALVDASRAYNASGPGFAKDVAAVQAVVDQVAGTYQATADAQQQVVDLLATQNQLAADSLKALQDAEFARQQAAAVAYYERAYTDAQAQGDTAAMLTALAALRDVALAQADRTTSDLLALQTTFSAVGQQIISAEILALQDQRTAVVAATDATAAAIVAGFSGADLAAAHALDQAARAHLEVMAAATRTQTILLGLADAGAAQVDVLSRMLFALTALPDLLGAGPSIIRPYYPESVLGVVASMPAASPETVAIATNSQTTVEHLQSVIEELQDNNAVLRAASLATNERLDAVLAALEENTTQIRRGLEGAQL